MNKWSSGAFRYKILCQERNRGKKMARDMPGCRSRECWWKQETYQSCPQGAEMGKNKRAERVNSHHVRGTHILHSHQTMPSAVPQTRDTFSIFVIPFPSHETSSPPLWPAFIYGSFSKKSFPSPSTR